MIAIINRTDELSKGMGVYGRGRQIYTLQINDRKLCTFEHTFEEGLATCLEKAAIAAKLWEKEEKGTYRSLLKECQELIQQLQFDEIPTGKKKQMAKGEQNKDCKICGRPATTKTMNCYLIVREPGFIIYKAVCSKCKKEINYES